MSISLEQAKREAAALAEDSASKGCLFSVNNMPEEEEHDDSIGDAENSHTLANLVVGEGVDGMEYNEALDLIENYIDELYPQFA